MLEILLFQLKLFLFIISILTLLSIMFHIIGVFRLSKGKIMESKMDFAIFCISFSYFLTILISGF